MEYYRMYEIKEGRIWRETYKTENELEIYRCLADELLACKVFKSPTYKRLKQYNNYDGTRTIIFYQQYDQKQGRSVYRVQV